MIAQNTPVKVIFVKLNPGLCTTIIIFSLLCYPLYLIMGILDIVPTGVITGDDVLKLFNYAQEHAFAIPSVNVTSTR